MPNMDSVEFLKEPEEKADIPEQTDVFAKPEEEVPNFDSPYFAGNDQAQSGSDRRTDFASIQYNS